MLIYGIVHSDDQKPVPGNEFTRTGPMSITREQALENLTRIVGIILGRNQIEAPAFAIR